MYHITLNEVFVDEETSPEVIKCITSPQLSHKYSLPLKNDEPNSIRNLQGNPLNVTHFTLNEITQYSQ